MSSESSESIVSLNVGGTIFQTSPSTMLKYPGSKLEKMFKEGQTIKNLTFFLDEDPEYFRIVLNFLRKGKLFTFDEENLFEGVLDLAKKFELAELVKVLENDWKERVVVLEVREKQFKIVRKFLTRVPESHMAKFFNEKKESQNPLSDCISKTGPNRYFIRRKIRMTEHLLEFMKKPANSDFNTNGPNNSYYPAANQIIPDGFLKELDFYGINEIQHFQKSPERNDLIFWNENYNVN